MSQIVSIQIVKPAGGYRIGPAGQMGGATTFMLAKKPCWLHRKMAKLLLGWEWSDAK